MMGGQGLGPASDLAHVLGAEALRRYGDLDLIAGHQVVVDHARGVVQGVFAGTQGFFHAGFAQEAVGVAAAHAFVDGVFDGAVHVHVLADLQEDAGEARVLADRHLGLVRDVIVFDDAVQDVLRDGPGFAGPAAFDALPHIGCQMPVGIHAQSCDHIRDLFGVDLSHMLTSRCRCDPAACRRGR